ncbi:hypothetical protein [Dyadobacter sp. CY343]|uniref:hypothetical protein n=1 Tax=Dyadobacter sp. CY343 TaxID=2907299 RepID=UPI001F21479E|nr:hypothetical protein [Dyadobacter sp. CY343]MCE7059282.1 hypothetical protein [Dyadobacter sp. CY343]
MKQLIAFALILFLAGCKKDKIDPHQAILGKWEEFYVGNGEYQPPIDPPTGYIEFMEDSVLLTHNYSPKSTMKHKYWIDSFLHIGSAYFSYEFQADTLKLNIEYATSILSVSKYKRIR